MEGREWVECKRERIWEGRVGGFGCGKGVGFEGGEGEMGRGRMG